VLTWYLSFRVRVGGARGAPYFLKSKRGGSHGKAKKSKGVPPDLAGRTRSGATENWGKALFARRVALRERGAPSPKESVSDRKAA